VFHLTSRYQGLAGADPVFALSEAARARKAVSDRVIDASLGVLMDDAGQLALLPTVTQALREVPPDIWAAYAPIHGTSQFQQAVKEETLAMFPGQAPPSVVVATPGGSGAIRLALTTMVEPGHAVLTLSPSWGPYATLTREAGCRLQSIPLVNENGRFSIDAFEQALQDLMRTQGRVTVLLNDPCQNPTGFSMTEADWQAVAASLQKLTAFGPVALILDLAYSAYAIEPLASLGQTLADLSHHVLVALAWSASKTLLHYGLRVGAMVVIPPSSSDLASWHAALGYACRGLWSNCNHGGMTAVARVFLDDELHTAMLQERAPYEQLLRSRGDIWNQVAPVLGLHSPEYRGGFFTVVFCDRAADHAKLLQQHEDVFVLPFAGGLRVALCSVSTSQVRTLAEAIARSVGHPM